MWALRHVLAFNLNKSGKQGELNHWYKVIWCTYTVCIKFHFHSVELSFDVTDVNFCTEYSIFSLKYKFVAEYKINYSIMVVCFVNQWSLHAVCPNCSSMKEFSFRQIIVRSQWLLQVTPKIDWICLFWEITFLPRKKKLHKQPKTHFFSYSSLHCNGRKSKKQISH